LLLIDQNTPRPKNFVVRFAATLLWKEFFSWFVIQIQSRLFGRLRFWKYVPIGLKPTANLWNNSRNARCFVPKGPGDVKSDMISCPCELEGIPTLTSRFVRVILASMTAMPHVSTVQSISYNQMWPHLALKSAKEGGHLNASANGRQTRLFV
jgi:hypothetical protein